MTFPLHHPLCLPVVAVPRVVMDVPENMPNGSEVTRSSSVPKWASDYSLQQCGFYYEGFVDNYYDFGRARTLPQSQELT